MLVKKYRKLIELGVLCVTMTALSGCCKGEAPVGDANSVIQTATEAPAAGGEESQQSAESMQSAESQEVSTEDEHSGNGVESSENSNQTVPSTWEEAYQMVVCNVDAYLADPKDIRQYALAEPENRRLFLQLYDFDKDDTPELIVGDYCCVSVFTWQNQELVRLADLAQLECWGGHDGMNILDGTLMLDGDGSQGSGYVFFAYRDGKYQTAKYCDYHAEEAEIDGVNVDAQEVRAAYNVNYMDYQHCGFYRVNVSECKILGYYFTDWEVPMNLKEEFPVEEFLLK